MKVVNLSRRPFVNRRPIYRLGVALWILGAFLVFANLALFQAYWSGSRGVRAELEAVESDVAGELEALRVLDRQIDAINLAERNSQAAYLNSLISYRTFPWSALFDDLERVLPRDVRLESVTPAVRLAAVQEAAQAEKAARQEQTRSRRGRSRRSTAETSSRDAARGRDAVDQALAADEVQLELRGTAKREDALVEFLDTLYADPAFRRPVLSGERFEQVAGALTSSFEIAVIYLTGTRDEEQETPPLGDDGIAQADAEGAPGAVADGDTEVQVVTQSEPATAANPPATTPPERTDSPPPKPPSSALASRSQAASAEKLGDAPRQETPSQLRRQEEARDTSTAEPSAAESAAAERQRRIEELRQRRREALRRNRSGTVRRPPNGDFLGTVGDDSGRGETPPTTQEGGSTRPSGKRNGRATSRGSREERPRGQDNSPASATPQVRGSLLLGLPEMLEGLWRSQPSPMAESLEELG